MSVNKKIAKTYLILVVASILGYLLSIAKEMLVAKNFGITKSIDAFYAASTIPNFINSVFFQPFNIIFIPIIVKYKLQNREEANKIASIAMNYIFLFLIIAAVIIFVSAQEIIKYAFGKLNPDTQILSTKILRIVITTTFFYGFGSVMVSILNAYENFLWPAISQVFIPISTILLILFFSNKWGIYVLPWGLLAGLFVQFIFLIPFVMKEGYRHSFDLKYHPEIKKALNFILFLISTGIMANLSPVINRIMASWLPSGSISALGYAEKLIQIPGTIFSATIATAVYPFFSQQIAENKIEELKNSIATTIKMTGFIFIPMAVIMIVLAKPTIQLVLQRGAFDLYATELTSKIFVCYSFQLFSTYAMVVMHRIFFIWRDIKSILIIVISSVILNVLFNFIFIEIVRPPAAGLALSASVSLFIVTIIHYVLLKQKIGYLYGLSVIKSLSKFALVAGISGIVVMTLFQESNRLVVSISIIIRLIKILLSSGIGMIIFVSIAVVLKFEEVMKVYNILKLKIKNTLQIF